MRLGGREFKEIMSLDFLLAISTGLVEGFKHKHKFWENPDVWTAEETIWAQGWIYSYLTTASKVKVSSSDVNDTSAWTWARTIIIEGLDANYNEISETISLNGQTWVETTKSFLRILSVIVLTAWSGWTAAGDIYVWTWTITLWVPAVVYAKVRIWNNRSLLWLQTIPAGYTWFLRLWKASASSWKAVDMKFLMRPLDWVFTVGHTFSLYQNNYDYNFIIPVPIPEKTDLEVRASSSASGTKVTCAFDVILIKN